MSGRGRASLRDRLARQRTVAGVPVRSGDALLALVMTVVGAAAVLSGARSAAALVEQQSGAQRLLNVAVTALMCAPVAVARARPLAAGVVAGVAVFGQWALGLDDHDLVLFAGLIPLYHLARTRSARSVALGLLVFLGTQSPHVLARLADDRVRLDDSPLLPVLFLTGATLLAAVERRRAVAAAERAVLAAATVHLGAAEERLRIARDLHDLVAARLSHVVLGATAARAVLDSDPAAARGMVAELRPAAAGVAERLRTGVLGPGDCDGDLAERLADAVAEARHAGLAVDLEVTADVRRLPAATAAAVANVVQEGLTNCTRYAPGGAVSVRVAEEPDGGVAVSVTDTGGVTPRVPGLGSGFGLLGLRERVAAVGGRLAAGPQGPGWQVGAVLPRPLPARGRWRTSSWTARRGSWSRRELPLQPLVGALLAVLLLVEAWLPPLTPHRGVPHNDATAETLAVLVALVLGGAVGAARRHPPAAVAAAAAAQLACAGLAVDLDVNAALLYADMTLLYAVATVLPLRAVLVAGAVLAAGSWPYLVLFIDAVLGPASVVSSLVVVAVGWALAVSVGAATRSAAASAARVASHESAATAAAAAQRDETAVRLRGMLERTVPAVVRGVDAVLDAPDRDRLGRALDEVADRGRVALADMRGLVGGLRADPDPAGVSR